MNLLIVPFWSDYFTRLRNCENVQQGRFRIGMIIYTTKLNNPLVIVAVKSSTL